MKLLILDAGKDNTRVSKINTTDGSYSFIRRISGFYKEQVKEIILISLQERPDKILVDNILGLGLKDLFITEMPKYGLIWDKDGTIIYK